MFIHSLGILVAIVVLAFGETLKNETKSAYIQKGYNWSKVILYSNLSAVVFGILSVSIIRYTGMGSEWNPFVIPFAVAITAYITTQSFFTDLRTLLINRQVLRVAYLSMYVVSLYNVAFVKNFKFNLTALLLFTALLILIFFFSSIGASDVRAMAVSLPFTISIGGYKAIMLLVVTLLIVSISIWLRNTLRDRERMAQFKRDNISTYNKMNKFAFNKLARGLIRDEKTEEELATPVGPYMITPFLIYLVVFPFLI